jgi:spermidine/putrescine transport system substrate-binding protein
MSEDRSSGHRISRRRFLGAAAGAGAACLAGSALNPCGDSVLAQGQAKVLNWLTWDDHYLPEQLQEIADKDGISANTMDCGLNSEGFAVVQASGGKQIDLCSADAFWVPKYYSAGLIEPFDLGSLDSARGLFDVAFNVPFWKNEAGLDLAFPFGWSPRVIAYNPKYVTGRPDSWEVLWDPKYKGKIAITGEEPIEVMAMMGRSLGFEKPFDMTLEQIQAAKDRLKALMPNQPRLVQEDMEGTFLLASEAVWLAPAYVDVLDDAPAVKTFLPKEGTIGYMDGEMLVKGAAHRDAALAWLDKMETGERIAQNFLHVGRPRFSREAYHWLVKHGYEERAKSRLFDRPELALQIGLKGPTTNRDATIKAYYEATSAQ